jgi:GTPase SAR1 family protein
MVVFDIGNHETFQACGKWLNGVRNGRPSNGGKLIGVLVGNKSDFRSDSGEDSRAEVEGKTASKQARDLGLEYFETSTATNERVEEPFKHIALEFYKRYEDTVSKAEDRSRSM